MTPYDLITIGRVGVDLYPLRSGVPLSEVDTFARFLGGSATNVAVAAARLGRRAAVVTRTGADPFGAFVHSALREYGVDDRFVAPVAGLNTPIVFCEIFPPDRFPLYFYRAPTAPDLMIRPEELDLPALRAARILWLTGTGLCAQPSRDAHAAALATREPDQTTVLDLDYRPAFWPSRAAAAGAVREALATERVSVAVGNVEECAVATGEPDPVRALDALLAAGVRLAVVKLGPAGVLAREAGGDPVGAAPIEIEVVNGLGAGDAFGGGLCHGLLAGWPLGEVLRYANAAGSIVAGRLACADAMPTAAEVQVVLDAG